MGAPCISEYLANQQDVKHFKVMSRNIVYVWVDEAKYLAEKLSGSPTIIDRLHELPTYIRKVHVKWADEYVPSNKEKKKMEWRRRKYAKEELSNM